jgi:hypothetical protein
MALEAYIPSSVRLDDRAIEDVMVVTLHDPDSAGASGSLTGPNSIEAGTTGRLEIVGRRDGKEWRVTLPRISVGNRTALGCEYAIEGPVEREVLRELGEVKKHEKALEERFDIR